MSRSEKVSGPFLKGSFYDDPLVKPRSIFCFHPARRAWFTHRSDKAASGLHASLIQHFFAPHAALTTAGQCEGRKNAAPTATDPIQSMNPRCKRLRCKRFRSKRPSWRLPLVLGLPQQPSIRADRDRGQSLFTACARRQFPQKAIPADVLGKPGQEPTHLTLGSSKRHPDRLRRLLPGLTLTRRQSSLGFSRDSYFLH